jgi:hypothetical protein
VGNLVQTGKDRSKVLLRFFEVLLDHPNSGAGLIPGRTGQCPVERDLYTVLGNLVKPGKTTERPLTTVESFAQVLRGLARSPKLRGWAHSRENRPVSGGKRPVHGFLKTGKDLQKFEQN